MAQVFVSYKSEDRDRAVAIAQGLEAEGLTVWWDPNLMAGDHFDEVIEAELHAAGLVVVLWSAAAARSRWVRSEANYGQEKGVLVPARIEDCVIPVQFTLVQAADLRRGATAPRWSGGGSWPRCRRS